VLGKCGLGGKAKATVGTGPSGITLLLELRKPSHPPLLPLVQLFC
jgi:hypothetical protein